MILRDLDRLLWFLILLCYRAVHTTHSSHGTSTTAKCAGRKRRATVRRYRHHRRSCRHRRHRCVIRRTSLSRHRRWNGSSHATLGRSPTPFVPRFWFLISTWGEGIRVPEEDRQVTSNCNNYPRVKVFMTVLSIRYFVWIVRPRRMFGA